MKLNRRYSVPEKAGNRKYMAIYPSPPSKHSFSELSITCGHGRLPLLTSHILSSGCHASADSALSSPLHITGCTLWLLSRDLITRAPGGRAPPMDRRVADSGSSGLSDTASYTARPAFALSLSLESRRQAKRNRELMWRCNDIISYWDDKYRHTGRVTIPFKLLIHRSHIGNSFLYHCIACRILIFWGDHIVKQFETFDGDFGFRTWNGNFVGPNDVPGWQLDNTYLQKKLSWIEIAPQ